MDHPESKEINLSGDGLTFATKIKITGFALIYLFGICFIAHIIMRCLCRRRQRNKDAGGLNPRILKTLPVVVIGEDDKEVFKNGSECVVCLSEFCDGERARILPKCQHGYHADCIDMWFQSHSDCPLCRSPVDANGNESSLDASSSSMAVVAAEESLMVESCGGPEEVSVIDIPKQMMDEEKEQEQDQAAAEEEESPTAIRSSDGVWVIDMPRQMVDQEKV